MWRISSREEQIILVLATQSSNYANTEVQISSVVRNSFTQMNISTLTKDSEDYVKIVDIFHCYPLMGETFAAW